MEILNNGTSVGLSNLGQPKLTGTDTGSAKSQKQLQKGSLRTEVPLLFENSSEFLSNGLISGT
ncbi:hypothetical protein [Bacillus massilinigeriensis]|uniref:hypothetical protein n=1 Tax=Bacillus massilionigeriensis TaxID=1805475 RepID=UPI00096B07BB|nr:hypothetical protein [Bacillus massilionigeriensis]